MSDRSRILSRRQTAALASVLGLLVAMVMAVGAVAAKAPASVAIGTASTSLGDVLAGPSGLTLYTLSSDPAGGSVCTGKCLTFWPPLLVQAGGKVTGPAGAAGTFSTFVRSDDGSTQVERDGRALYYFANDTAAGQTNGEGIQGSGGVWHVALASAAAPGSTAKPTASAPAAAPVATTTGGGSTPPATSTDATPGGANSTVPLGILALVFALAVLVMVRRLQPRRS